MTILHDFVLFCVLSIDTGQATADPVGVYMAVLRCFPAKLGRGPTIKNNKSLPRDRSLP